MFWSWVLVCAGLAGAAHAAEVVTLAAEDDWAPYSSARADGSGPEGLAPDLVRAAFKTQNVDVRFVVVPFARCLHYAETGQAVGCFDTTRTEANKGQFHWHATPMFHEELAIFTRSDQPVDKALTQKDLQGHTVGVTIGYTYPTDLMEDQKIGKRTASSDDNLIRMLVAKRVDYILLNTMPGYYRLQKEPALRGQIKRVGRISLDGFWISFSRSHPDGKHMAEVFERGLQTMKHNGDYERMMSAFKRRLQP